MARIAITTAESPADVQAVADLFREYVFRLGRDHNIDVAYQDFAGEMATFPDRYILLLLARVDDAPAAAVALKALTSTECEMKRLYCRDAFRGLRLGHKLVARLLDEARSRAFGVMRLDTHPALAHAIGLYEGFGFLPSEPHNEPDDPSILYFACTL